MLAKPMAYHPAYRLSALASSAMLVAFVGFCCPGCGRPEPARAAPASSATDDDVIGWALGSEQRTSQPAPGERFLVLMSAGQTVPPQGPPAGQACYRATSFLQAPVPDMGLYVVIERQLQRLATPNARPALLTGADKVPNVTRLLAFARRRAPPLELLVAVQPPGEQREELRLVTIEAGAIKEALPASDRRIFANPKAFFKNYDAPRCQPGGQSCLVLSRVRDPAGGGEATYLDQEPVRNEAPKKFMEFGKTAVADVAWAPGDGQRIWLLMPCEPT